MSKQPEITDKTRQVFVDVFAELYMKKDINRITVRELAELAGTSRATFYRYFQDVYAIFEYIGEVVLEEIRSKMSDCISANVAEEIIIERVSEVYEARQKYLQVLFKENGLDIFTKRLVNIGKEQMLQNLHLPAEDVRLNYILDYYMTAIVTILGRWVNHPEELTKKEMTELIKGILLYGVLDQIKR